MLSDSHGDLTMGKKALLQMGQVDLVLHAGDHYADAVKLSPFTKAQIIGVRGNVEPLREGPEELLLEYEGVRIFLTHGHLYHVKFSLHKLFYKAKEAQTHVVVFGHTHHALKGEEEGILFLNPGSVSRPRGPLGHSYAILELKDGMVTAEILEIV